MCTSICSHNILLYLTFIYTFLLFPSELLFMCHGMLMHASQQMAGSSLLDKLTSPMQSHICIYIRCNYMMQSRDFELEDIKNTYKFFAVLLLVVTVDVMLSATCTPESGCKATMEDGTKADFCSILQASDS